jgi:hypothetical protein
MNLPGEYCCADKQQQWEALTGWLDEAGQMCLEVIERQALQQ